MTLNSTVFLVDVDNTLLNNDRIQTDLQRHLEKEFGVECRDRYWTILEQLFSELGYRDYLGALQRYRVEHPRDIHLLTMSSYLVDYPFANRLYPGALDVLAVEPQQVVLGEAEAGDRRFGIQATMRSMPVVTMQPSRQRVASVL